MFPTVFSGVLDCWLGCENVNGKCLLMARTSNSDVFVGVFKLKWMYDFQC